MAKSKYHFFGGFYCAELEAVWSGVKRNGILLEMGGKLDWLTVLYYFLCYEIIGCYTSVSIFLMNVCRFVIWFKHVDFSLDA